jgi:hypothetical protein
VDAGRDVASSRTREEGAAATRKYAVPSRGKGGNAGLEELLTALLDVQFVANYYSWRSVPH